MVNAAGPEPPLRNFEAATLTQDDVLGRDAYILEQNLGMAVRSVKSARPYGQSRTFQTTANIP